MQLLRRNPSLRKSGRSIDYLAFFRHNTGHNQDGSQAPGGQTRQIMGENCSMDHSQEGKKARDSLYCGLTATCSQSCLFGKSLPLPDVRHSSKAKEMHYFTKLDVQFCSDICWWHTFLTEWNGVSLLRWDNDNWTPKHCI